MNGNSKKPSAGLPVPNVECENNVVGTAAELGRMLAVAQAEPTTSKGLDDCPYIILRDADGKERIEWLKEKVIEPHRKTGTVKLNDVESFNAYYAIHGNGAPVYATMQPAKFIAVLNEHTKDKADYRDHRAVFTVEHSKEWATWTNRSGHDKPFASNEAFALFLEDNAPDIIDPSSAHMLQIALNFRVKADVAFSVAQRLQDGQINLGYSNLVNASAEGAAAEPGGAPVKLTIPEKFTIEIPVFAGLDAPKYRVSARFRYRLREGKLSLWFELERPHKVVEAAFKVLWDSIKDTTKAPVLHGTPE